MAYLYLDESGQFKGAKNVRSVVGGIFCKREIKESDVKNIFNKYGKEYFDEKGRLHSLHLNNQQLSQIVNDIIDFLRKRDVVPVLFIPKRAFFIVDDTITYLNILADGILKLLIQHQEDISPLCVVIEQRKETSPDEYRRRLKEIVEKRKALSGILNKNIELDIIIDNKSNVFLQIADLIVHTFYRLDHDQSYYYRTYKQFDDSTNFNPNIKNKFKEFINAHKVYLYTGNTPEDLINEFIFEGDYINGLLHLFSYGKKHKTINNMLDKIINQLCILELANLTTILNTLLMLYYNAINSKRLLNEFEKDIKFIINEFLPKLQEMLPHYGKRKEDINWAYTFCYMILLTLYNHKGDVQKFEEVYQQIQIFISSTPFDLDSLTARLRIRVLHGVHLTNMYAFEQCYNEMMQLERKVSDAFTFLSESDDNLAVQPRILGEIRGTKLQAIMYHTLVNGGNWDKVREVSDEAIRSFVQSGDIQRQYQYRAQIETYAKNFDEAKKYVANGCGVEYENDIQLLEYIVSRSLIFPLFHFLRICYVDVMSDYTKKVKDYYEMIKGVFSKYDSNIERMLNLSAYPVHTLYHYVMVLWYLHNSNTSKKEADEFYQKALELCRKEDNITMKTIELSLRADYIWMLSLHKLDDTEKLLKRFYEGWDKVLQKSQQTLLYTYLSNAKEKYKTTHVNEWNTLWYIFPF